MVVVGEAADGKEALAVASEVHPDIIVLDLDLKGKSALDLMPMLFAAAPQAHVLLLTGIRDPTLHQCAIRLGARGLVLKERAAEVLLKAIVKVHAGEAWLERTMMANVLDALGHTSRCQQFDPEAAKIATLTDTGPLVALIDSGEADHRRCRDALKDLEPPMLTTWPVLITLLAAMTKQSEKFRNHWKWIRVILAGRCTSASIMR